MSRDSIFLIGHMCNHIAGSKLPSNRDCLRVLFYIMRIVRLNLQDSSNLVVDECIIFWRKARIPIQDSSYIVKKLKKLYECWRNLDKNKKRNSAVQKDHENDFKNNLDNLFDIAHSNAMNIIKIDEDKCFLSLQRKKGRVGCMQGIDKKLFGIEKRRAEREHRSDVLKQLSTAEQGPSSIFDFNENSSDEFDISDQMNNSNEYVKPELSNLPRSKRARKEFMTARLASALDKCKVSDRDAVHLITACVEAFNINYSSYVINRSTIKRSREHFRCTISSEIKSNFHQLNLDFVTVHWDSKLLPNLTGTEIVDRLPVIISAPNTEQLLGVPQLTSGTGNEIASAVYDTLQEWELLNKVQAFVFDTTASNSGRLNGSCVILEQMLDRPILFLACRHHVYEIILQSVFSYSKLTIMSGPDIPIFKRFKNSWKDIDSTLFCTFKSDDEVENALQNISDETIIFCKNTLATNLPRDDYKELLELVIIFLGGVPPKGIKFYRPGAYHLARWMSKAIYCLKIFIFQNQFLLTKLEKKGLKIVCCFIIKCYVEYWFRCPNVIEAPLNDILFLKRLVNYKEDNKQVAEIAIKKFVNHLWYFGEEVVLFSLFDDRIDIDSKSRMAKRILEYVNDDDDEKFNESEIEIPKKYSLKYNEVSQFLNKDLPIDLITPNSKNIFCRFQLNSEFLHIDPVNWVDTESFRRAKHIIQGIKVVNDVAERGIKLMEEYNTKFTKKEDQKQYLLKVVQDYRKNYPSCEKYVMAKDYNN